MANRNPKRKLGLWLLTALVIGNMIGSGVFLLPSSLASFGSISILAWIFTSVGALFIAFVFARLGGMMPKTGGPYAYCRAGFGDFLGLQVAYSYWIAAWLGNAGIANAFTSYLSVFWPQLNSNNLLAYFVTITAVWSLTILNCICIRKAGIFQLITTILKLMPILLISIVGIFFIHPENFAALNTSSGSLSSALTGAAALTLWAFIGVESASVPAGSVENPKRNIPLATILGTCITATVYIASTVAIMGLIPNSKLISSAAPFADAAYYFAGEWGKWIVGIGAVIACAGTLNGWILLQGQIPMAAAEDNLFPRLFKKKSKNDTPVFGLVFSSMLITILLTMTLNKNLVEQFTFIILLATFASLIPYFFTSLAEILIMLKAKDKFDRKHFAKNTLLASLACIYSSWAIYGCGRSIVFYGMVILFSSAPFYVVMKGRACSCPG